jgi:hypothetical protein
VEVFGAAVNGTSRWRPLDYGLLHSCNYFHVEVTGLEVDVAGRPGGSIWPSGRNDPRLELKRSDHGGREQPDRALIRVQLGVDAHGDGPLVPDVADHGIEPGGHTEGRDVVHEDRLQVE